MRGKFFYFAPDGDKSITDPFEKHGQPRIKKVSFFLQENEMNKDKSKHATRTCGDFCFQVFLKLIIFSPVPEFINQVFAKTSQKGSI